MKNNFFRIRWLDFRQGHSIYLAFLIYFADTILIQYALLIEKFPFIDSLLGANIVGFAIIFIALYVPLATIIGYWHRKSQWTVEVEALFKENKVGAIMWLFVIDLVEGKINEKEKKEMREMLLKITKGKGKSTPEDSNENTHVEK
jgi:hypothetical protein